MAENAVDTSNISQIDNGQQNHSQSQSTADAAHTPSLYKTELCRTFVDTGSCRYGVKCRFAHGDTEVRPVARHKKYKTERCKNYVRDGVCPYGHRCRFIHEDITELMSTPSLKPSSGNDNKHLGSMTPLTSSTSTNLKNSEHSYDDDNSDTTSCASSAST